MSVRLLHGDCLEVLRALSDESIDALVTDPPAAISFMGRDWDHDHGGRTQWVARFAEIFAECLRVLKPGAHAFVWALPRTSHWTATALEDAGFEIREICHHIFGQGFPKSLDVSKALDRAAGAERDTLRIATRSGNAERRGEGAQGATYGDAHGGFTTVSSPATDAAKQWQGWGTALKPATEHWILCRKPLGESTVACNVLQHGTGAINVDACRVDGVPRATGTVSPHAPSGVHGVYGSDPRTDRQQRYDANLPSGRWPANLLLTHSAACKPVGTRKVKGGNDPRTASGGVKRTGLFRERNETVREQGGYADPDGTETVEAWECAEDCPVAELDRQSGERPGAASNSSGAKNTRTGAWGLDAGALAPGYGDTGGASRFFPTFRYEPKADRDERTVGGDVVNMHPTVKSVALMRWLCRLITPPGGIVLDCFMGSGTTGVAAAAEGFSFVGIEREAEYFAIAKARIEDATRQGSFFALLAVPT